MTRYTRMSDVIMKNELSICSVPQCNKHRKGISLYCHNHRSRDYLYGHPLQKRLHSSLHAHERNLVAEIFRTNSDHPGILHAIRFIQEWMDTAITSEPGEVLAGEDARRLHDNGITAKDIVIESAAFYIYQQANKYRFLNDDAVDIAASLAVLQMAPLDRKTSRSRDGTETESPKRIRSAPRKKLGKWIRERLIGLFVNLQTTIEANRNATLTVREAMYAPLTYPAKLISAQENN